MAQEADRRAHPAFRRVGQERLAQVPLRQAALQPLHGLHCQGAGLPDAQQQVAARVAQGQQQAFCLGQLAGGVWCYRLVGARRCLGRGSRRVQFRVRAQVRHPPPRALRFGGRVGSGLITVVFLGLIATDRPRSRFTDRRIPRTRRAPRLRLQPRPDRPGLRTRQRCVREQLGRRPLPVLALVPPLMDVTVLHQLLLGLLVRAALHVQLPCQFAEGAVRGGVGETLDVQDEDLGVAVDPPVAYDRVRGLRPARRGRDNMTQHFWWVLSTGGVGPRVGVGAPPGAALCARARTERDDLVTVSHRSDASPHRRSVRRTTPASVSAGPAAGAVAARRPNPPSTPCTRSHHNSASLPVCL